MVIGLGIDVVKVERLRYWMGKKELLSRFFHPDELNDAYERGPGAVMSLAVRFAAKEAYGKALGTGLRGFSLTDIQVKNNELGKPEMVLYGNAKAALEKFGGARVLISLTHEEDNGIAIALIEGE
jgi:holo-[acyl-carrier protein] synthase